MRKLLLATLALPLALSTSSCSMIEKIVNTPIGIANDIIPRQLPNLPRLNLPN